MCDGPRGRVDWGLSDCFLRKRAHINVHVVTYMLPDIHMLPLSSYILLPDMLTNSTRLRTSQWEADSETSCSCFLTNNYDFKNLQTLSKSCFFNHGLQKSKQFDISQLDWAPSIISIYSLFLRLQAQVTTTTGLLKCHWQSVKKLFTSECSQPMFPVSHTIIVFLSFVCFSGAILACVLSALNVN